MEDNIIMPNTGIICPHCNANIFNKYTVDKDGRLFTVCQHCWETIYLDELEIKEQIMKDIIIDKRKEQDFKKELEGLINKYSLENGSNTPDFILAEAIIDFIDLWNKNVMKRSNWYGNRDTIGYKE